MVHMSRLVKMDFLQGRSERTGEAYIFWYLEPLSAARTKLEDFCVIRQPL